DQCGIHSGLQRGRRSRFLRAGRFTKHFEELLFPVRVGHHSTSSENVLAHVRAAVLLTFQSYRRGPPSHVCCARPYNAKPAPKHTAQANWRASAEFVVVAVLRPVALRFSGEMLVLATASLSRPPPP